MKDTSKEHKIGEVKYICDDLLKKIEGRNTQAAQTVQAKDSKAEAKDLAPLSGPDMESYLALCAGLDSVGDYINKAEAALGTVNKAVQGKQQTKTHEEYYPMFLVTGVIVVAIVLIRNSDDIREFIKRTYPAIAAFISTFITRSLSVIAALLRITGRLILIAMRIRTLEYYIKKKEEYDKELPKENEKQSGMSEKGSLHRED